MQQKKLADQRQTLRWPEDKQRIQSLDKQLNEVEAQIKELYDFAKGNLGDKRPDLTEFFLARREFATSDASYRWWEELHNIKHETYDWALEESTGLKGAGLEIETLERSRLIEANPPEQPSEP